MDTLKTAVVVVLLLAVLYGAWVVLNGEPNQQPFLPGGGDWQQTGNEPSGPEVEIGGNNFAAMPTEAPVVEANPQQALDSFGNVATAPTHTSLGNPNQLGASAPASPNSAATLPPSTPPAFNNAPQINPPANAANGGFPTLGDPSTDPTSPQFGISSPPAQADNPPPSFTPEFNPIPQNGPNVDQAKSPIAKLSQPTEDPQWLSALEHLEAGRWRNALFTLTLMYQREDLEPSRRGEVLQLLDPLAAKVIYSREHLMEPPHRVVGNESLQVIAQQYNVPWQLLANINGINDPTVVLQGTELKVLRGPFRADVDLQQGNAGRLTLFVGSLYAGQFDVTSGQDPAPKNGEFQVLRKEQGRNYFVQGGQTIAAGHPNNPYGTVYIDLGQFAIHGSSLNATLDTVNLGCISLSPKDAEDVFGILSEGSNVTIRR